MTEVSITADGQKLVLSALGRTVSCPRAGQEVIKNILDILKGQSQDAMRIHTVFYIFPLHTYLKTGMVP